VRHQGFRPFRPGHWSPPLLALAVVALLVAGFSLVLSPDRPTAPGPNASNALVPVTPEGPTAPPVHPASSVTVAGTFYGVNSTFANLPAASDPCGLVQQNFSNYAFNYTDNNSYIDCYGGAQNPSLLNLANGDLGIAYSTYTTNESNCTVDERQVVSRVGFQVSSDSGAVFGAAQYLGNQTCSYLQAIEPSFTVSSSGSVYGTFVEENETSMHNALGISLPTNYSNRTSDALGFTTSKNNGASFARVSSIAAAGSANIARPQIAAFGQSIYIVYDELNNWTNITLNATNYSPYPAAHPIAVELVWSSDGGAVWQGPYTLPGLNASQGYNAFSPAIAVSSTGELAVAYATDRECYFAYTFGFGCDIYGDAAVVATSATNGTTWSAPAILGFVGEAHQMGYNNDTSPQYWYDGYAYQFQASPELAVAWSDISSTTLFAAWSGSYAFPVTFGTEIGQSGVFSGISTNGGKTWANGTVAAPSSSYFGVFEYDYDPALAVHAGTAYLSYTIENESGCYGLGCNPFAETSSYWMVNSTNGTYWGTPTYLTGDPNIDYETQLAWVGYSDALAYTSDGPVASFSQPEFLVSGFGFSQYTYPNGTTSYYYWYNETGQSDLTVALPWTGPTVALNLTETGLPAGTVWNVNVTGLALSANVATIVLTGVPVGQLMYYQQWGTPSFGFWTEYAVLYGSSGLVALSTAGNVTFDFELEYGFEIAINPSSFPDFNFNDFIGNTYFYWDVCGTGCGYFSEPFPWFVPAGTYVPFDSQTINSDPTAPIAFTGYGNGSSSVVGSSTAITVNGPINETVWFGALGEYPVTFVPSGLPASSAYSFTFGGTVYSANGTQDLTVANVSTGAYGLGNITANSSTPGWAYFGQASTGSTVVVPNEIEVLLNFSAVDLAAPAGTVSFQATGLAAGDFWSLTFNGTAYGSDTPLINVTVHPGNYSASAVPVPASANDSTAYSPVGFGPIVSVATGSVYPVDFTPTYRVEVIAGAGGSVTGAGSQWLTPGSTASFTASAHPDYDFLGWSGSGPGSYSGPMWTANITVGGPVTEAANFQALPVDRFNLTFQSTGLPSGTWWTVDLGGIGYSSDASTLVVSNLYPCAAGNLGQYSLGVLDSYVNGSAGTRYVAGAFPSSICTTGTTSVAVTFATEYLATPIASGGGSALVVVAGKSSAGSVWVASGASVGLKAEPDVNDLFLGWVGTGTGSYTGPSAVTSFPIDGPVAETATFAAIIPPAPVTYSLGVHTTSALESGTSWAITLAGVGYSTTGAWINISGLAPNSYTITVATSYSPDGLTEYVPVSAHVPVTLTQNQTASVTFGTSYWVNETASLGGSLTGAVNGFEPAGRAVVLGATPSAGYEFVRWVGTGSGSYSGTNASDSAVVNAPLTELASFAPIPSAAPASSGFGAGSLEVVAILAVVGLVVGLGIGYVATRGRQSGGSS
jgi:hypothetical protein